MSLKKVSVVVAGSWGTALASVLADNEYHVMIWTRSEKQAEEINKTHHNSKYLPGVELSPNIIATTSMEHCLQDTTAVVLAAHSAILREVAVQMRPYIKPEMLFLHAAKGFETDSLKRMSEVLTEELPDYPSDRFVVISGPSHAEEVAQQYPTTVVVAAKNRQAAEDAQDLLINPYFRVYTNPDIVGVEIGGALKNIIALGAGLSDGLGFGDNAKAALLTRGLAEIARLGRELGASPVTFSGLAGIGDLVVTGTSKLSRNWRAGYQLGQGQSLEEILETMGMVVEGVKTTKAARFLSEKYQVTMPITQQLYEVLFHHKPPREAVEDLMERGRTHEVEEIAQAAQTNWLS